MNIEQAGLRVRSGAASAGLLTAVLLVAAACSGSGSSVTEAVAELPQQTPTDVPVPTATPIPEPTVTPIPEPTATPVPTATPEPTATPIPEPTATVEATPVPTTDEAEPDDTADEPDEAAPEGEGVGATVFAATCASCHGQTGEGTDRGPALIGIGQFFVADASPITNLVTNGGTNMPAFAEKLTAEEIDAVVQYVVETYQ